MEESGQRPSHLGVISRDEIKSPLRRFVEHFVTTVCWAIYLYLLLPLFTLVLWAFGIRTFYDEVIGVGGYEALIRFLKNGSVTALVIFVITVSWARYNYAQFKRRGERRSSRTRISSDDEIARWLGVDAAAVGDIRRFRCLEVRVEKSGYRVAARE
jgi:poly-beta-1,6-N-acetyl-D-glucosamine biosynthesis protein PgaD